MVLDLGARRDRQLPRNERECARFVEANRIHSRVIASPLETVNGFSGIQSPMPETPYRDRWHKCPACPNSELREFEGRLICDACNGMMITRDDLAKAIRDLTGADPEFEFFDDKPTKRACPRCDHALVACRLRVKFAVADKEPAPKPILDRCEQDGIWFDTDELAKVLAAVRHVFGGGGGGGGMGGAGGRPPRGSVGWWPGA